MRKFCVSALCVFSVFALLISLASCSSNAGKNTGVDNSANSAGANGTGTANSGAATTADPMKTLKNGDFNGYEFNIFGAQNTAGIGDYFFRDELTGDIVDDAVYYRNQSVEEKYNVKIKVKLEDWTTATDTIKKFITAGDNTYDLYAATILKLGSLITSGYFVNWKDVPSIDLSMPWFVQEANKTYSLGDRTMLLFGDFMETNVIRCWNMVFNKRLADVYKIDNLYGVVDNGRWTIDYLINTTKDIVSDLNGDSKYTIEDLYGLATDQLATLDAFSRPLGLSAIKKNSQNLPELSFFSDNTVKAFEKVYQLYYEDKGTYVHSESLAHIEKVFSIGHAMLSTFRIDYLMSGAMRAMEDDYGVLPYPKLDEKQDKYYTYLSGTFSAQMIPVTQPEENHERTGIIVNALNAYGYSLVTPAIYDITLKTKTSRDQDSVRMLDLILKSRAYSFDACDESAFPLSPLQTLRSLIGSKKSKDIASYYTSVETSAQDWIAKMIESYESSNI